MKPVLKLKKQVVTPVDKTLKVSIPQSVAAARRLANAKKQEEQHARNVDGVGKLQPLIDSYFSDKPVLRETVFIDGVECFRPLCVGTRQAAFVWFRAQPQTLDYANTLLNNLIELVLHPHVSKPQYLAGVLKFDERFNLDGVVAGVVTAKHKAYAKKLSELNSYPLPINLKESTK